ncbi:hypothetical protein KY290_017147 [Solanum tuberosum]|uniref:Uncharacterized protein n=1 Tax=Solanum tuberosum TaxID=4113 RepID=A0ABQ7VAG9_SOLTU|nr:hypothetical protein KY289_037609 [Solanum tuberosum]KAH0689038.1 hypothetical protein KY289_016396 [Solanum tuberosum]KAH0761074.1 hypothetical protein KY290_017147 [Solanum tuberosum]
MQTRGRNTLVIEQHDEALRHYIEQLSDDQDNSVAQPFLEQLVDNQNNSVDQAHDGESNELNSSVGGTAVQPNDESGNLATRKPRGPTLLKDVWKLPPGKTIDVPFNSRNQSIGKEGRKLASFLGIVARTPELTPLNVDDWRNFDNEQKKKLVDFVRKKFSFPKRGEAFILKSLGKKWKDYKCEIKDQIAYRQWSGLVSYWLSDKAKRRTQANRNNRANQKMPHTGGSKAENGIEPTRAEIFLLTHKKCVDGRPLDDDSAKAIDMINERMTNNERSTDQPPQNVALEGDVYSQVLGNEKSGYVRGLGLGPTPSVLWGSKSSVENIVVEDSSNEVVQRLEQEITELKEKQNEEMDLMKQNHEKLQSELLRMRQFMQKYAPNESFPQDINDTSNEQVPNHNSGQEGVPQSSRISNLSAN